jgi:REP element-mobilizing transposase RayT
LNRPEIAGAIHAQLQALGGDAAIELRAWVVTPEHLHLFFTLTGRLTVGPIVGRLKAKTRASLLVQALRWQGNFYEHRLRPGERVEDVLRYLFLNPYRAKLVSLTETYPHGGIGATDAEWLRATLDDQHPFPEWPGSVSPVAGALEGARKRADLRPGRCSTGWRGSWR